MSFVTFLNIEIQRSLAGKAEKTAKTTQSSRLLMGGLGVGFCGNSAPFIFVSVYVFVHTHMPFVMNINALPLQ